MRNRHFALFPLKAVLGEIERRYHAPVLIGFHRNGRISDGQMDRTVTALHNLTPFACRSPFFTIAHVFLYGPPDPFLLNTMTIRTLPDSSRDHASA